jgi:DNA-binding transcriptional ArsR family regulator
VKKNLLRRTASLIKLPYELQIAIEGLNSPHRQKILLLLDNKDKLSFSEIEKESGLDRTLLASHLRKLNSALLVEHFYEHEVGNTKFSYYKISALGKTLLQNLLKTLVLEIKETRKKRVVTYVRVEEEEASSDTSMKLEADASNKFSEATAKDFIRKIIGENP